MNLFLVISHQKGWFTEMQYPVLKPYGKFFFQANTNGTISTGLAVRDTQLIQMSDKQLT